MADQSFSSENFRKILDIENRKGVYLEGQFFPEVKSIAEKIKRCRAKIREKKKDRINNEEEIKRLNDEKKNLENEKEKRLAEKLQETSEIITKPNYKIEFKKVDTPDIKSIYIIDRSAAKHYFALKQIQQNLSKLYDVKQANRTEIIKQVKFLLNDRFPKYVLRTDVKDFYETIPNLKILRKIERDNLLSPLSKKILRKILNEYKNKSGNEVGIPRGVGVSAYLAELYMRKFDDEIHKLNGVIYYARYVDDIIIIFTPKPNCQNINYKKVIKDIIEKKYNLIMNEDKTFVFDLRDRNKSHQMNFLGYKITFGKEKIKIELTEEKFEKYKDRITLAFKHYKNLSKVNEKKARKILIRRIRFLTGNTKLLNNKRNILTGIYYSNDQLTEHDYLNKLDDFFRNKINTQISFTQLKLRLKKYSFLEGYKTKRFSPFNAKELFEIMKIWKKRF
jgi:hypothetical protein